MTAASSRLADAEMARRLSALKGWQREGNAITQNDFDLAEGIDRLSS